MKDHMEPERKCFWKISLVRAPSFSFTRCPCVAFCSVILRDVTKGDHLLIHLSPALLSVLPPLCYQWLGLALFLSTLSVAANMHFGQGRRSRILDPPVADWEKIGIVWLVFIFCPHRCKQLMSCSLFFAWLNWASLSWFETNNTDLFLRFSYFLFSTADIQTIPLIPLFWPLGLKHRELIITWTHTPWNR